MTHQIDLSCICWSLTYILWSSDFASCLEDYYSRKVVLGMIDQCHSETDLVNFMWVNDLYTMIH